MDDDDIGDVCDKCNMTGPEGIRDRDSDTVDDICDNCPQDSNEDQRNDDNDETGNACDIDDDNDRISKSQENIVYTRVRVGCVCVCVCVGLCVGCVWNISLTVTLGINLCIQVFFSNCFYCS